MRGISCFHTPERKITQSITVFFFSSWIPLVFPLCFLTILILSWLSILFPFKVRPLVFQSLNSVYRGFAITCLKSRAFAGGITQEKPQKFLMRSTHSEAGFIVCLVDDTVTSFCYLVRRVAGLQQILLPDNYLVLLGARVGVNWKVKHL